MNGWKIAFWILFVVIILETVSFGYVFYLGNEIINDEYECQINICADYDSYYYDLYDGVCYCYEDNEIVVQKFLG